MSFITNYFSYFISCHLFIILSSFYILFSFLYYSYLYSFLITKQLYILNQISFLPKFILFLIIAISHHIYSLFIILLSSYFLILIQSCLSFILTISFNLHFQYFNGSLIICFMFILLLRVYYYFCWSSLSYGKYRS